MGRIGGGRRFHHRTIGFGHRGMRRYRRPLFWHGRLAYRPRFGFYGPALMPYRFHRWRYVHGYHHYSEYELDSPREQLPPDGPNFAYVPMFSMVMPSVFNKLQYETSQTILQRLNDARTNAPGADCCSCRLLCCLIPVVGWCFWCAGQNEEAKNRQTESVNQACQTVTAELGSQGISVSYVQFPEDESPGGFVFEVQPFLADGSQNPLWTGAAPQLDPATKQAVMMDYTAAQGGVSESALPNYEDIYRQSATALQNSQARYDNLVAIAHKLVITNWFQALNPQAFTGVQQQAQYEFTQSCRQLGYDEQALMTKASEDLGEFQRMNPMDCAGYSNNPQGLTTMKLLEVQQEFLDASALEMPPPYNPNAPTAPPTMGNEFKGQEPPNYTYQQAPPSYAPSPYGTDPRAQEKPLLSDVSNSTGTYQAPSAPGADQV